MTLRPIRRLLVANRGEIAVRVIRTCRDLGVTPIAVYSDADAAALHVRLAEEAYRVGPAPSSESYLDARAILEVATRVGADAIHPGYGFLSENADFARACGEAGVTFVGPPAESIRAMGDKTEARRLMASAGVPMAPGTVDAIADIAEAVAAIDTIGLPVLIKAAAGGGGKGMRSVLNQADIERSVRQAQSEALSAFSDGRVYVEKLLHRPRHIEFQILADGHGNVVHLFERECSIQRRHQKVIEEAPSSVLNDELRTTMGEAAVQAARACGYVGAGTVEFLLDQTGEFYFLEMNTRLQVEHPVTEMISGIDLVAEQIRIAEGAELGYRQDDVAIDGHAIEARVYAEDVASGFLPSPGRLLRHRPPSGPGIRVDAGVEGGDAITPHYDPMISKVVSWARERGVAIARMDRALREYDIAGVETTIPFCRFVMRHDAFRSGHFDTGFVDDHFDPGLLKGEGEDLPILAASIVAKAEDVKRGGAAANGESPASQVAGWVRRRELR